MSDFMYMPGYGPMRQDPWNVSPGLGPFLNGGSFGMGDFLGGGGGGSLMGPFFDNLMGGSGGNGDIFMDPPPYIQFPGMPSYSGVIGQLPNKAPAGQFGGNSFNPTQLMGLLGPLLGAYLNTNQLNKAADAGLNASNSMGQMGKTALDSFYSMLKQTSDGFSSQYGNKLPSVQSLLDFTKDARNNGPGNPVFDDPRMSELRNLITGRQQAINPALDSLYSVVSHNGQNGYTDDILHTLANGTDGLALGRSFPQTQLGSIGNSLISSGGTNSILDALSKAGVGNLNGSTPQLDSAIGLVQKLLGNGGTTSTLDKLQSNGLDLFNHGPNLSPEQAAQWAGEQALTQAKGQAAQARAQAYARGGGPGSVTAGGAENNDLAAFSDQIMPKVADASRNAFIGQEGVQLQRAQQGLTAATQGAGLGNDRLASLLGSLSSLTNTGTNLFNAGVNAAGTGQSIASRNMGQGTDMLSQLFQSMLGGGNLSNTLVNSNSSRMNSAFGNLLNGTNSQSDAFQKLLSTGLQGTQTGMQWVNDLGNLYGSGAQLDSSNIFKALGGLQGNQNGLSELAGSLFRNVPPLIGDASNALSKNLFWGNLATKLGTGVLQSGTTGGGGSSSGGGGWGDLGKVLGGIFGGSNGGGGGNSFGGTQTDQLINW